MATTSRQKKLVRKISENLGKPLGEVMREVGYSEEYANNPQQLTRTKGWQELMEQLLPDEPLLQRLKQVINNKNDSVAIKGLDTAFKVKGRYAAEKVKFEDPLSHLTAAELLERRKLVETKLKETRGERAYGDL